MDFPKLATGQCTSDGCHHHQLFNQGPGDIQLCQQYLQVTTLSQLRDNNGATFLDFADGALDRYGTPFQHLSFNLELKWPDLPTPTPQQFKKWRELLNMHLLSIPKLGPWRPLEVMDSFLWWRFIRITETKIAERLCDNDSESEEANPLYCTYTFCHARQYSTILTSSNKEVEDLIYNDKAVPLIWENCATNGNIRGFHRPTQDPTFIKTHVS